jgi:hypothetical protein
MIRVTYFFDGWNRLSPKSYDYGMLILPRGLKKGAQKGPKILKAYKRSRVISVT